MTNTPSHTPKEATFVRNSPNASNDESDSRLLVWNQRRLEPFAEILADPMPKAESQVELKKPDLKKVELTEQPHRHERLHERFEEIRHAVGNAWHSMEHAVDDAVSSISSGRDL